jgi:hypothetical protein
MKNYVVVTLPLAYVYGPFTKDEAEKFSKSAVLSHMDVGEVKVRRMISVDKGVIN